MEVLGKIIRVLLLVQFATATTVIINRATSIAPPSQHFTEVTNGTEFPLEITDTTANRILVAGSESKNVNPPLENASSANTQSVIIKKSKSDDNALLQESSSKTFTTASTTPIESVTNEIEDNVSSTPGNQSTTILVINVGDNTKVSTVSDDENDDYFGKNSLIPRADINASIAQMESNPKGSIVINSESDCPSLADANSLSQTQLIQRLTHGCRYDRLERPITFNEKGERLPVNVYARAYVYFMQNLEAHDLQFQIHALLQLRFVDPRLVFREVAPKRKQPILGEKELRDTLWVPHIFLANERESNILGTAEKDILTSISPDGTVIISTRIKATLYCWMNLQKFPFDDQHCSTVLESWMYNTSELVLHWEQKSPITIDPEMHLTEYVLIKVSSNESVVNADLNDLRHGAFAGNYSSLSFTVFLTREVGFYLMDYFLPSMMIVAISWVSFWLQADQSAPRIMLGTSTMLTFITLASGQSKNLPKVSYIKVSEVWFLGCTLFIFGSLVEFAFVNTIWRRKKNVELKKINSKYILKSTLTPRLARREIGLHKSRSCSSLDGSTGGPKAAPNFNNYLTVHTLPIITTQCEDDYANGNGKGNINHAMEMEQGSKNNMSKSTSISIDDNLNGKEKCDCGDNAENHTTTYGWTTMTPQEISYWIDRRARFLFPLVFIVFNAIFWTFVYCL